MSDVRELDRIEKWARKQNRTCRCIVNAASYNHFRVSLVPEDREDVRAHLRLTTEEKAMVRQHCTLKHRFADFISGYRYGYPLCCVIRYSLSRYTHQAIRRGGVTRECVVDGEVSAYVTCGIFHSGSPWGERGRVLPVREIRRRKLWLLS
ncbi:hypothetical protein SEA_FORZA_13 [Gordonia phage Forza]|uniref:Uncharacterized protein n=1 Tax=Gordonia phage Forza TaxID=2571247 RepID=A0A650EXX6_9CAUD|nr:hypothetical protein PP303_gp013 [Gordonia phage Forza]QEM41482.1 hypothetical protein SEA_BOOPY_13 [Gordonia phage Boopy]QGT55006.1 hypothetical protein SEA_FORZA_13 [Gordonia phage Forza]UXE04156.1 hypothetical protein SEA_BLUENGOLD_12 [Gordonia phage BlueNGold]WBF03794.1 hypothetical protein SEA_MAREELIH_11 [Gordonia phage Mareelih]